MNTVDAGYKDEKISLSLLVKELVSLLNFYFSQNWFLHLLEDMPGNTSEIHELCRLLAYKKISLEDKQNLDDIIILLEQFIHIIKRFLLPVLREKLRISGLSPDKQLKDRDQRVKNGFIAAVFPDNIKRISHITEKIKLYLKYDSGKALN